MYHGFQLKKKKTHNLKKMYPAGGKEKSVWCRGYNVLINQQRSHREAAAVQGDISRHSHI